jgi:hypothetical protein
MRYAIPMRCARIPMDCAQIPMRYAQLLTGIALRATPSV